MPLKSNHIVADWLSRGYFSQLLDAGVRIFRFKDAMVHAKTSTVDGSWSTVGTANIDRLSLQGNYEINVEVIDHGLAKDARGDLGGRRVQLHRADPRRVGGPRPAPPVHRAGAQAAPPAPLSSVTVAWASPRSAVTVSTSRPSRSARTRVGPLPRSQVTA